MRRLARHVFTLCAALSLLLCVAVCVLWVRSYWVADRVVRQYSVREPAAAASRGRNPGDHVEQYEEFVSERGVLRWDHVRLGYGTLSPPPETHWWREPASRHAAGRRVFAFEFRRGGRRLGRAALVAAPHWCVALAAAVPAVVALRPIRRLRIRGLRRVGRCAACGYDLRATPGRCPECGTASEATT